ncbi:hypothetical protein POM88_037315 [Heracleum sosnowskyi]|uniref:Uncharacterized protein n=1 Tax=Heracleum sosnowskyi TaxID=360622 RepID=A0AAD8MGI6_9APIA|nr:hypothetical protein POM88_037315 [Heracleum sosnowskyi]
MPIPLFLKSQWQEKRVIFCSRQKQVVMASGLAYFDPDYENLSSRINPPRVSVDNTSCKNYTLVQDNYSMAYVHSRCKKLTKLIITLSIHDQANVHENKTSTERPILYPSDRIH